MSNNTVKVATAVGVGLAAGALATYLALNAINAAAPGDEPPIHVKGGSIHFDLVTKQDPNNAWIQDGAAWTPGPGLRNGDKLAVFLVASTDCEEIYKVKSSATFTYTDDSDPANVKTYDFTLTTKAGNNGPKKGYKSIVTPPTTVTMSPNTSDARELSFGPANVGYISKVTIDKSSCDFKKGEFQEAFVFEW